MNRRAVTDTRGVTRIGPVRAWWPNLRPRLFDGLGISYEVPRLRAWAWNAEFVAGEAVGTVWVHACGFTWAEIAAGAAWTAAAGTAYIFTVLPYLAFLVRRRHEVQVLRWQADAAVVEAEVVSRFFVAHGVDISRAATLARLAEAPAVEFEAAAA